MASETSSEVKQTKENRLSINSSHDGRNNSLSDRHVTPNGSLSSERGMTQVRKRWHGRTAFLHHYSDFVEQDWIAAVKVKP